MTVITEVKEKPFLQPTPTFFTLSFFLFNFVTILLHTEEIFCIYQIL
jgi:hypothetical protein